MSQTQHHNKETQKKEKQEVTVSTALTARFITTIKFCQWTSLGNETHMFTKQPIIYDVFSDS